MCGRRRSGGCASPGRSIRRISPGGRPPTAKPASTPRLCRGSAPMIGRNDDLKALVRTIPDFPKPGIQFRDITTLLLDPQGFAPAIERLAFKIEDKPDLVAGIEARGFILAAALAQRLGAGVLLIRKDGKLPGETIAEDYALEYGSDRLNMHIDACAPG